MNLKFTECEVNKNARKKIQSSSQRRNKKIYGDKYRQEFIIGKNSENKEILKIIYGNSLEHILKRAREEFSIKIIQEIPEQNSEYQLRRKGTGSVFLRKDGRWTARFYISQKNGKRNVKVFYGDTEEEVVQKLDAFRKNFK
jgi:hypothetical protein